jgi:hypothetical protein
MKNENSACTYFKSAEMRIKIRDMKVEFIERKKRERIKIDYDSYHTRALFMIIPFLLPRLFGLG